MGRGGEENRCLIWDPKTSVPDCTETKHPVYRTLI